MNAFHVNNSCRLIAFHRWLEGSGADVIVIGTLSEGSLYDYEIGFPHAGVWREIFSSDFFESALDHKTTGNGGAIYADSQAMHGFAASARIIVPANGVLAFAR